MRRDRFLRLPAGKAPHRGAPGEMGGRLVRVPPYAAAFSIFPPATSELLARLQHLAGACWRLFGLRGYARVDFRVDRQGQPWILEINANPCLSPDAGFVAAAGRAGLSYEAMLQRILDEAFLPAPAGRLESSP